MSFAARERLTGGDGRSGWELAERNPDVGHDQAHAAEFRGGDADYVIAVGQTIRLNPDPDPKAGGWKKLPSDRSALVVGVARDVMSEGPAFGIDATCIYLPANPTGADDPSLTVRVGKDSSAMRRNLEAAIAEVSKDSVEFMIPMEDAVARQIHPFQVAWWIGSFLGGLALLLTLSVSMAFSRIS